MRQEMTCVSDPFAVVCIRRLTLLDTESFSVYAIGGEPHRWIRFDATGTAGTVEPHGLIDYPYGNEPLGRFLLYRMGTN